MHWERMQAGGASMIANLGTGQARSIRSVIAAVERVTGRKVPVFNAPRRPGDPPALVADAKRAGELLDFGPEHSGLEKIIETACRSRTSESKTRNER